MRIAPIVPMTLTIFVGHARGLDGLCIPALIVKNKRRAATRHSEVCIMQTFIYDFDGVWMNGVMYIRANDQEDANEMFKAELKNHVMPQLGPKHRQSLAEKNLLENGDINPERVTIQKIKGGRRAEILWDGDY